MPAILAATLLLAACGSSEPPEEPAAQPQRAAPALAPGEFPASLAAMGDGYPDSGDPCRKLGESDVTSNWLDDSAMLVGCPDKDSADHLGGTIVEVVDGFFLVSLPVQTKGDEPDLPSTGFNATAVITCAIEDEAPEDCDAGVRRKWGEDGTTLVEVTRPDGSRRGIFFRGTEAYGAESARADGSANWPFDVRHDGGNSIVRFGPELYVIPDELVVGR